ncbi:MAG: hypothetical protein MJZ20_02880 [Bacteroidaceae bacterium]|nr:hypothetical protein [Bacteroidaceae bacterium]
MAEKLDTIKIKSKDYTTVDARVMYFREHYKGWRLVSEYPVLDIEHNKCVCISHVVNPDGVNVADGIAYEWQSKAGSMVNSTSFIENAQTSAIGRALGFMGIGINGYGIATAEEVKLAVEHQDNDDPAPILKLAVEHQDSDDPAPKQTPVNTRAPAPATEEQIKELKSLVLPENWEACAKFYGHERLEDLTYTEARRAITAKKTQEAKND